MPTFVTAQIDAGFVDVECQDISGNTAEIIMTFPGWRERQKAVAAFAAGKAEDGGLIALTVKDQEATLNRLSAESLAKLDELAMAMVFGDDFLKKTKSLMARLASATEIPTEAGSDSKPN